MNQADTLSGPEDLKQNKNVSRIFTEQCNFDGSTSVILQLPKFKELLLSWKRILNFEWVISKKYSLHGNFLTLSFAL